MTKVQTQVRLAVYDLPEGKTALPTDSGQIHFVYTKSGTASVIENGRPLQLVTDNGTFVTGDIVTEPGASVWMFEKADPGAPLIDAEVVASHTTALPFASPYIIRVDRIESRHGAQTPKHGHRGPGIRRLVFGKLRAEIGHNVQRIQAGDAWFETGQDPVVGTNYGGTNAAFVRMLVLPAALAGGKSSFLATNAAEAQKPRSVEQRLFGEVGSM